MTQKQKKIVNKIRFLVKLEAWDELNKKEYYGYLTGDFSCVNCDYKKRSKCEEFYKITNTGMGTWCFAWLNESRLDKSK